ncbi:P-loop ATPase, Sll1717 family [Microbacterium testaceum]|uniref:P-loop ATPase, Sll1717 family n=1 Tax=Microbacterium testaceum TaxID=2033 RepID=UPI0025AFA2E8|nr:hypothetical protein [Microbacterium testaceum]WJS91100.1 hypothetical protein NYQ11_00690 [Microbacterium testaceum]
MNNDIFVAYGSESALRAETMRDAVESLRSRKVRAESWENMSIAGQILIEEICRKIDESSHVFAEVSSMNSNVLFEAGYALGRDKHLFLLMDETDATATRLWSEISLLGSIGRVDYGGSVQTLVSQWFSNNSTKRPGLLDGLLAGGKPKEADAIFAPALPIKFQAATSLERFLERRSDLKLLGSEDDLGLAPLAFYAKEIYRSSAAVFHLLAPNRVKALEHNARASFLAGLAHGLEIPTLIVAESGFKAPLDYRDMLYVYPTSAKLTDHVGEWLNTLPTSSGGRKRLGRLVLDVELPISSFGQYVAEYEREELSDYFINTSEFASIMRGDAKIFVGRKGTGKTATMLQAVDDLRKDRRNLVVSVKPSGYELADLIAVARNIGADSDYVLHALWSFLLYTEIACHAVRYNGGRNKAAGADDATNALSEELDSLGISPTDDMSARLESAVARLQEKNRRPGEQDREFIARELRSHRLGDLRRLTLGATQIYNRVAVLIDNLDKAWENGADYAVMARFILALLTTVGSLEREFQRPANATDQGVRLSLTVFLRADIFDRVANVAREPDKIRVLAVHWQDEELLSRVLEERYSAMKSAKAPHAEKDLWDDLFATEVRGAPMRDYVLWRTLPRPRDIIYLANSALTTAINRRHRTIEASDVLFAEGQYSKFAFDALIVESDAEEFDLEEILYEFAGVGATMTEDEVNEVLSPATDAGAVINWLMRTSFLGVEVAPGEFRHVEGRTNAKRQLRLARRFAERQATPIRFRVHPAFRHHLEIRDDDLHDGTSASHGSEVLSPN